MAITTLGAIALGIGALGSAAISRGATGTASRAATDAANQSADVQREQLQASQNALMPYINSGLPATGTINALLGLGGTAGTQGTPAQPDYGAYVQSNPDLMTDFQKVSGKFGGDPASYGQYHWNTYGQNEPGRILPTTGGTQGTPEIDANTAALQGFDTFRNSTGYQFRLGEGMNALNSQYAGAGAIKSGAAMRAATEYGQNFASNEFGNYLTALGNQQGVGLSAGSALAGVGQNYANSMASINDARATGIGNAALSNASNLNSMIGTLGAGILKYG